MKKKKLAKGNCYLLRAPDFTDDHRLFWMFGSGGESDLNLSA
jgi:hypothetical protein